MRRLAASLLTVAVGAVTAASAVQTRFWDVAGARAFLDGRLEGVSLRQEGELLLAPDLVPIPLGSSRQPFLWDTVLDRDGNLYVGSGARGIVYRVDAQGEASVVFRAPESHVYAVAIDSGGNLLVGASPPGRIYRVGADGDAVLMFETGERYIWDLVVGRNDRLYVATGERGVLLTVDAEGESSVLFDADEPHLLSLALDLDDSVLASSAGSGLLYEIEIDGRARVVLDADGDEVAAVALLPDGTAYAAINAVIPPEEKKDDDDKKPQERITGELPQGPSPAPQGIEDLAGDDEDVRVPDAPRREVMRLRSTLVRIPPVGPPQVVWESASEGIQSLQAAAPQRIYFGTGVPGGLYLLDAQLAEGARLLARFPESQLTSLAAGAGGQIWAATSNDGRLYRAVDPFGASGTFVSKVLDARGEARWGQVAWDAETPAGSRVELTTRSGSSARPDATWSDWSPAYARSQGTPVTSPQARYLQLRARLSRLGEAPTPRLRSVRVSYREENLPPRITDLQVTSSPQAADSPSSRVALTWSAQDANDDALRHSVHARRSGDDAWSAIATDLQETRYTWDTADAREGSYRLQVRTTDAPDNDADSALSSERTSELLIVDHTGPEIEVVSATGDGGRMRVSLRVTDGVSPVVRADYSVDGAARRRLQAEDGLDDGLEESYELTLEGIAPGRRTLHVEVADRAGNRRSTSVPVEVSR